VVIVIVEKIVNVVVMRIMENAIAMMNLIP
jgi:hypothetical protein